MADRILAWNSTATGAVSADEILDTQRQMRRYAAELVDARRATPGDDVPGALIAGCDERGG